jgi:hypothetical protein
MMRSMDVAKTARDLPDARMRNFVWGHATWPGFNLDYPLDELPQAHRCVDIGRRIDVMGFVGAALGDDGFHHLVDANGRMRCRHNKPVSGTVWPDGFSGREYDRRGRRWVKWHPALTAAGEPTDPLLVSKRQRCPGAHPYLPGDITDASKLGRIRRQLVDEFGPGCMICPDPWAVLVDHDHLTGIVRGYLCRDCNTRVDNCHHLDDCAFATYLNDPPALRLEITHPNHAATMKQKQYPERRSFYDIVMAGGTSIGNYRNSAEPKPSR